jgi:predicted secreted acid phosphatase
MKRPPVAALLLLLLATLLVAPAASTAAGLASPPATAEVPTADVPTADAVARIVDYHDSGAWARDTTRVTARATAYVRSRLRAGADPRRLTVVFDIDDTSLSTYDCMKQGRFARDRLNACVITAQLPPIAQTLALFRYAQARHVGVAFVTGRPDIIRTATLAALRRAGYRGRYTLVLRPESDHRASVIPYKSSARARLERGGRRIVVNVGDQRSDLAGGHARRSYLLPNPMYVLP